MSRKRRTGRVLLTLDPETLRGELVETAVGLARAYDAELVIMFVKTADMINMAALPFETTVVTRTGHARTIRTADLDRQLDRQAREAEALVARAAGTVRWSFRVATGHVEQVVAEHATEFDLLTVCGSTARRVRRHPAPGHAALMLLGDGLRRHRPVVAVYEGDATVLATAHRISKEFGTPLIVALIADDRANRTRLRRNARAWLSRRQLNATMIEPEPDKTVETLQQLKPGLIAVGRTSRFCAPLHDALDQGMDQAPMLEVPD
ncbi:MAG: hypothetical protein ACE363_15145 [Alphaproteobacteria bacterium]